MRVKVIPQAGYTAKESAQMAAFVADFVADTRPWQQKVIDNAPADMREAIAAHLNWSK